MNPTSCVTGIVDSDGVTCRTDCPVVYVAQAINYFICSTDCATHLANDLLQCTSTPCSAFLQHVSGSVSTQQCVAECPTLFATANKECSNVHHCVGDLKKWLYSNTQHCITSHIKALGGANCSYFQLQSDNLTCLSSPVNCTNFKLFVGSFNYVCVSECPEFFVNVSTNACLSYCN
jgi:hypothetical protein